VAQPHPVLRTMSLRQTVKLSFTLIPVAAERPVDPQRHAQPDHALHRLTR
jgi:hypothetical protein